MRRKFYVGLILIAILFTVSGFASAEEKLGLIVIAHGSPRAEWNGPVLDLEGEIKDIFSDGGNNPFTEIRVALMEFNEPSIATVVNDMQKHGIDRLLAIPLFIAPSGHSFFDIPTILGLYHNKPITESIIDEGISIVNTKMNITVGATLNNGGILKEIILDRVKELSSAPDSEGVIILAHGDSHFSPIWEALCREIGSYVCAKTGIEYVDFAFVAVGQSFITDGVPVISRAAEKRAKTIVVGLYVSMGVANMSQNSALDFRKMKFTAEDALRGKNILFAKRGLLPDSRVSMWLVEQALDWAGRQ